MNLLSTSTQVSHRSQDQVKRVFRDQDRGLWLLVPPQSSHNVQPLQPPYLCPQCPAASRETWPLDTKSGLGLTHQASNLSEDNTAVAGKAFEFSLVPESWELCRVFLKQCAQIGDPWSFARPDTDEILKWSFREAGKMFWSSFSLDWSKFEIYGEAPQMGWGTRFWGHANCRRPSITDAPMPSVLFPPRAKLCRHCSLPPGLVVNAISFLTDCTVTLEAHPLAPGRAPGARYKTVV